MGYVNFLTEMMAVYQRTFGRQPNLLPVPPAAITGLYTELRHTGKELPEMTEFGCLFNDVELVVNPHDFPEYSH